MPTTMSSSLPSRKFVERFIDTHSPTNEVARRQRGLSVVHYKAQGSVYLSWYSSAANKCEICRARSRPGMAKAWLKMMTFA